MNSLLLVTFVACLGLTLNVDCSTIFEQFNFNKFHPIPPPSSPLKKTAFGTTTETKFNWFQNAQDAVKKVSRKNQILTVAKNGILFLGDGMSIPSLMATRVSLGGEEYQLSFEKFPYSGLSKTYCDDFQVPDSSCTSTAYLGGVKANFGTCGVNSNVKFNDCTGQNVAANQVRSIAAWAQSVGKSTGIITTTTVTHASPSGAYVHIGNRMWESNVEVLASGCDDQVTSDIAEQLIRGDVGKKLDVIMGGGRMNFLPTTKTDEQGFKGYRTDGADLINEWKTNNPKNAEYIYSRTGLKNIKSTTTKVLGLFSPSHFPFHVDAVEEIPLLSEMVEQAIKILSKNPNGYFLFVEGGEIDFGHHYNLAHVALDETHQLSQAVERARNDTCEYETLIVVTSDHSHTMSVSGYPARGSNIFGAAAPLIFLQNAPTDNKPLPTLNYANGPGYFAHHDPLTQERRDINTLNYNADNYLSPAGIPLDIETHGGDDVGIFASGPHAHMFSGVHEQNYIPHAMAYAMCIGSGEKYCD